MTNQANTRSTSSLDAQVGQAWSYHFRKENDKALVEFQRIVEQDPNHLDAQYGLGLVLAATNDKAGAIEAFKKTAALIDVKLSEQQPLDEDSRYRMLARMVAQQLERFES